MAKVLVVDDSIEMARSCSLLVSRQAGLEALGVDSPDAALRAIVDNAITVVVLDQIMPMLSGTQLLVKLREMNPFIRGIMLSGEATREQVGEGYNLFNDFVSKQSIELLPEKVLSEHVAFYAQLNNSSPRSLITSTRTFGIVGARVDYELLNVQVLDHAYVDPNSWTTYLKLEAGEERTYKEEVSTKETFALNAQSKESIKASVGVAAIKSFTAKLDATIEESHGLKSERSMARTQSSQRVLTLPSQPDNSDRPYIKSRHLSHAPIWSRVRALIGKSCRCCGETTVFPILLDRYTGFYLTRHEDYLSDGTADFRETGKVQISRE